MDVISGGKGADTVDGGAGDDMLYGDAGDDTILGEGDNDTITLHVPSNPQNAIDIGNFGGLAVTTESLVVGCLDQSTANQNQRQQKRASRDALSPKARCASGAPSTWLSLAPAPPQSSTPFHQATSHLTVRLKSYNPFEHPSHA